MSDNERDYPVKVTLKAGSGYDAPWVSLGGDSAAEVTALMEKNEGADLKLLMDTASGAGKAFNATWTGKALPEPKTQGKPPGADVPSPQKGQDPYDPQPVQDDAPPWGEPATPQCKHGNRKHQPYKGVDYWVCGSDLAKGDPNRCDPITR